MEYLRIETSRDAYSPNDIIRKTLTVGELMEVLEEYDEGTPVLLSFDNGYTYGWLGDCSLELDYTKED